MAQNIKARLDEVKRVLVEEDNQRAAELLGALANDHFPYYSNTALLLQSRANSLRRNISFGTLSYDNAQMERNRLSQAILSLHEDILKEFKRDNPELKIEDSPKPLKKPIDKPDLQTSQDTSTTQNSEKPSNVKTILFLTANPESESTRNLVKEHREIFEGLKHLSSRDDYKLEEKFAVRVRDMRRALNEYKPTIVHFSVMGTENGDLVIENDDGSKLMIKPESISKFFKLFQKTIQCVVLNADFSKEAAKEMSKYIPCVIGMSGKIDKGGIAVNFATGFYDSLDGGSYEDAFNQSKFSLSLYDPDYEELPVIFTKSE